MKEKSILEIKAGEFIDLEFIFLEINKNQSEKKIIEFIEMLCSATNKILPTNQKEVTDLFANYVFEVKEIKETYSYIYNPPPSPLIINENRNFYKEELIKDFESDYKGYYELIYLICKGDLLKVNLVCEMKNIDFLFWGEYLIRKKTIELC